MRCSGPDLDRPRFGVVGETDPEFVVDSSTMFGTCATRSRISVVVMFYFLCRESCTPASGSTFALGTTTVNCTASDAAGNTGTASFNVTVVVDASSISTLDDEIAALGLPNGVTRSLQGPLNQAQRLLNDANPDNDGAACDKVDSFLGHVQDHLTDGNITASQAAPLTAFAEAIKVFLGCP